MSQQLIFMLHVLQSNSSIYYTYKNHLRLWIVTTEENLMHHLSEGKKNCVAEESIS